MKEVDLFFTVKVW